ncbi:MAG: hypothetical protein JO016_06255 [Actinobacteria bacterium]|nr:hypothetical protein [Actinomycetota bacterium]
MTNDYDVATTMTVGSGVAALSAAPQGAGATGLSASWCTGAFGFRRPLLADLGQVQVKPGSDRVQPTAAKKPMPTNRTNHNYMTRVIANSEGGSGPQPLREQPPA